MEFFCYHVFGRVRGFSSGDVPSQDAHEHPPASIGSIFQRVGSIRWWVWPWWNGRTRAQKVCETFSLATVCRTQKEQNFILFAKSATPS